MAHKIVAILLDYHAYINYSLFGLLIGLFLKFIGSPIIFFIPRYVSIYGIYNPFNYFLILIAGPLSNLSIYFLANSSIFKSYYLREELKRINLALFISNSLPIPPLDDYKALTSLLSITL